MHHVPVSLVRDAIRKAFVARDLSATHAGYMADTLVETSLLGIDTHGVALLPTYLLELEGGRANRRPQFRVIGDMPAAGIFYADNALGVVAANAAIREAMDRASRSGVAALAISDSNHFGAAGYYARLAAQNDQIGLVFSNSDALVAPAAGAAALNGTNPLAMAAPGISNDGLFLDMATSEISYSRLMRALGPDSPKPGPLTPLGGYKGQGLGTMVQVLCSLLPGLPFDSELTHLYEPPYDSPRRVGHFVVVIHLRAFIDPAHFRERLSELLACFRSSSAIADEPVLVAGDPEARVRKERLRHGLPLGPREIEVLSPFLNASQATEEVSAI